MREYRPRIVDEILKDKLEAKGAIRVLDYFFERQRKPEGGTV